ncbi:hypothetical protein MRX96_058249 [Rhipicephalus microplus]
MEMHLPPSRYEDNNLRRAAPEGAEGLVCGASALGAPGRPAVTGHRWARTYGQRWHCRGHGGGKDIRRGDKRGDLDFQKRSRRQPKSKKRRAVPRWTAQVYPKRASAPLPNRRARERARGALNLPVARRNAALSTPRLDASLRLLSAGALLAVKQCASSHVACLLPSTASGGTWTVPLCSAHSPEATRAGTGSCARVHAPHRAGSYINGTLGYTLSCYSSRLPRWN